MGIISGAVFSGAVLASARWTWWRGPVPGLPVLAYQKVGEPPAASTLKSTWVAPDKFRAQISWLLARGYTTLLFSDLVKARSGGKKLPEKAVLITFDGAYENTYTRAYAILRELGAKGNVFAAFNTIGKADLWQNPGEEPWVSMATLEMLKEMRDSGLIEFGSHTMNHPRLEELPPEDAAWELTESKKQLESVLGREICAFAYPYGSGARSPEMRTRVFQAGYALDFCSEQGKAPWPWNRENKALPRLIIRRGDNNLDLKLHLTRGASRL
jgi:peptidoglycan/xylan/chitin deacetylase (PgdA/CDA1 family)